MNSVIRLQVGFRAADGHRPAPVHQRMLLQALFAGSGANYETRHDTRS